MNSLLKLEIAFFLFLTILHSAKCINEGNLKKDPTNGVAVKSVDDTAVSESPSEDKESDSEYLQEWKKKIMETPFDAANVKEFLHTHKPYHYDEEKYEKAIKILTKCEKYSYFNNRLKKSNKSVEFSDLLGKHIDCSDSLKYVNRHLEQTSEKIKITFDNETGESLIKFLNELLANASVGEVHDPTDKEHEEFLTLISGDAAVSHEFDIYVLMLSDYSSNQNEFKEAYNQMTTSIKEFDKETIYGLLNYLWMIIPLLIAVVLVILFFAV